MKASQSVVTALADIERIETGGDVGRVCSEMLLGLARKEVPAADVEAAAKMVAAQAARKMADLKTAQWAFEMRQQAATLYGPGGRES